MTALLGLAARWLLDPKVLIALAVVAAVGVVYVKGRSDGAAPAMAKLERERGAWASERAKAAEAAADWQQLARAAEQQARNTERTWLEAARSIDRDGIQTAEKLRAAVARADAAGVGLSAQLGAVVADAARAAEAGASAADARQRQAAAEASRVLAELLGRCDGRIRTVARYADQAAAAGTACERWAQALEAAAPAAP